MYLSHNDDERQRTVLRATGPIIAASRFDVFRSTAGPLSRFMPRSLCDGCRARGQVTDHLSLTDAIITPTGVLIDTAWL